MGIIEGKSELMVDAGNVVPVWSNGQKAHFDVVGQSDTHSVYFDGTRWSCTCKYFSLHDKKCSHILACSKFLIMQKTGKSK